MTLCSFTTIVGYGSLLSPTTRRCSPSGASRWRARCRASSRRCSSCPPRWCWCAAEGALEVTMPRRVLFINDTARNGGPGRSLHAILSFLDPAEVDRMVLLPREDAIARLLRDAGVVDELDHRRRPHRERLAALGPRGRARRPRRPLDVRAPAAWRLNVGRIGRLALTLPRLVRERGVERHLLQRHHRGLRRRHRGQPHRHPGDLARALHVHPRREPRPPRRPRPQPRGEAHRLRLQRLGGPLPALPEKIVVVHNAVDVERYHRDATPGGLRGSPTSPRTRSSTGAWGASCRARATPT